MLGISNAEQIWSENIQKYRQQNNECENIESKNNEYTEFYSEEEKKCAICNDW